MNFLEVLLAILFIFIDFYFILKYLHLFQIKGYNFFVIAPISLLSTIGINIVSFYLLFTSDALIDTKPIEQLIYYFLLPNSFTTCLLTILSRFISPKFNYKGKRIANTNILWAQRIFFTVMAAAFCIILWVFPLDDYVFWISLVILFSYTAASFDYLKEQKQKLVEKQSDINEVIARGFKVLYLRSFYLDSTTFFPLVKPHQDEYGNLIKFRATPYSLFNLRNFYLTFEQYFGYQVCKQIGDMVCLGNPQNGEPMEGIIDIYPDKNEWQEVIRNLFKQTEIILVHIGTSIYLSLELKEIIETGNLKKLCILTEPDFEQNRKENTSGFWNDMYIKLIVNIKKPNLRDIRNVLIDVGFKIDFTPDKGSVIIFDANNNARQIATNCKMPSEYIQVVKNYFRGASICTNVSI